MGERRRFRPEIPLRGVARVAACAAALALVAAAAVPWAGDALAEGLLGVSDGTAASSLSLGTDGSPDGPPASTRGADGGVSMLAANPTTLTVGGTDVLSGGCWKTNADGTLTAEGASAENYNVKYDSATGTLTLKDATINGTNTIGHVGAGIYAEGDLTIVLEGSSTVTGVQDPNGDSQSIRVSGNLTIQGGGSLTAQGADTSNGSSYGIFVIGSFTQQSGSVTASGGNVSGNYNSTGLYVYGSTVTVQGGTLTATGGTTGSGSYGISANGSVTVSDATVTATGGTGKYSYGLYVSSNSPSVTLSDSGSLTARSGSATNRAGGIYFQNPFGSTGSVTVGNGSTLLTNSVIRQDINVDQYPLAPTGNGSWLIYGQSDQTSAVGGTYTLTDNLTIENGNTFTIPAGSTLNLGGHTLTVDGTLNIANQSSLAGEGTLTGDGGAFNLTNPDPVISGSETLTYDGTDQFSKFQLEAPTGTVEVMGKDFTISSSPSLEGWSLNQQEVKNAGTYTLTASNGTTNIENEVTVEPAEISIASATVQDKTYDGNTTATVESVTFDNLVNGESLSLGTDYTATATFADKNVGDSKSATVTVTLKGGGNYTFAQSGNTTNANGTIRPLPVVLNWETTSFTYDGSAKTVTAKVSNAVDGDTFTLTYEGNTGTAVGNYTAKVTDLGNDNYTLTGATDVELTWSIGGASIAGAAVELSGTAFTYNGQSQKPTVTVKLNGNTLNANTDYTVDFGGDSINAGTYTVTVTGTGNYSGTATSQPTYTITKADQAALSITSTGPATYGQDYALTASGGSGSGAVTFTVVDGTGAATVSGNTLTPTRAGDVTVSAAKAGDDNHNDGTSVSVTITISKGTYDGTMAATGSVIAGYPGSVRLPDVPEGASFGDATYSGGDGAVTGLSVDGSGTLRYAGGSGVKVGGEYVVTVKVTDATNYEDYDVTVTLTGAPRPAPAPDPDETETVTNPDGTVTTTVTHPDGSSTATTSTGGGTEVVVETPAGGGAPSVSASVSSEDASSGAVALPVQGGLASGQQVSVSVPEGGATVVVPVSGGASPSCVLALVGEGGELTVLPKTASTAGGLGVALDGDSVIAVVAGEASFPDLSGDEWFADEVAPFVASRGILTGVVTEEGTTEFRGGEGTDRAMFVTMLHRLELEPEAGSAASFPDVSGDEWFAAPAAWGDGSGIVTGYEDGTGAFGGADPVTREQMAVFMFRYAQWLGLDTSARATLDFPDAGNVSDWAREAMSWAVAEGLFTGDGATGALRPTDGASRAEAAAVVMRLVNGVLN